MNAVSFLPDWYLQGGMYVALPFLALLCFGITMFSPGKRNCTLTKTMTASRTPKSSPRA